MKQATELRSKLQQLAVPASVEPEKAPAEPKTACRSIDVDRTRAKRQRVGGCFTRLSISVRALSGIALIVYSFWVIEKLAPKASPSPCLGRRPAAAAAAAASSTAAEEADVNEDGQEGGQQEPVQPDQAAGAEATRPSGSERTRAKRAASRAAWPAAWSAAWSAAWWAASSAARRLRPAEKALMRPADHARGAAHRRREGHSRPTTKQVHDQPTSARTR